MWHSQSSFSLVWAWEHTKSSRCREDWRTRDPQVTTRGNPQETPTGITPGDPLRGVPPGPPGGSPRRSPREPPRGLPRGLPAITCNFSILYKETDPETILDRSSSSSCVDLMCCSSKMDGRKLSYDFLLVGLWPPTLDILWRCAPTCPHACW